MDEIKISYDEKQYELIQDRLNLLEKNLQQEVIRKSVNDVTRSLHEKLTRDIPKYIDRPKQITIKSLYAIFASAKRGTLTASVEFKSFAGKKIYARHWLYALVHGKDRRDKGLEVALKEYGYLPAGYQAVPTNEVRTDGYGNIPGGLTTSIISFLRVDRSGTQNASAKSSKSNKRRKFFIVKIGQRNNLPPGIYEYRDSFGRRAIRKVFIFTPVKYKKRYPFYETAMLFASEKIKQVLFKRVEEAITK